MIWWFVAGVLCGGFIGIILALMLTYREDDEK